MEIRKVKQEEYNQLIALMNKAFNFNKVEEQFEHILPKLYYKENNTMIHIGAYENNKLVASIGLYPMTLISNYGSLNAACVGAVSTHPDYRNKGYFTILIQEILKEAEKQQYDLLFLGGDRTRYGHYGFEYGGIEFNYELSRRSYPIANLIELDIETMNPSHVNECLSLYNKLPQRVARDNTNFIDHLRSWNCIPYVVSYQGNIIGYYTINHHHINELVYKDGYKDFIYQAILSKYEYVHITSSIDECNDDTLSKCNHYYINNCEMYKILNLEKVAKYLNFKENYKEIIKNLDNKQIIRNALGNGVNPSILGDSMYIAPSDRG